MILHAVERRRAQRLERPVARNRPERPHVADARQRRPRHPLARRALGDDRQRFRVAERGQRLDGREALGLADALERLERDVAQHVDRLASHGFVAVVARDARQRRRIHQLRRRRAPHARLLVLARHHRELLALVDRQLGDKRQPHRGIGMLVTRLRFESVE